jgi:hypothetical protein
LDLESAVEVPLLRVRLEVVPDVSETDCVTVSPMVLEKLMVSVSDSDCCVL